MVSASENSDNSNDPAISLLEIYPRELKICSYKILCMNV